MRLKTIVVSFQQDAFCLGSAPHKGLNRVSEIRVALGTISDVSPPSSASKPVQKRPTLAVLSIATAVVRTVSAGVATPDPKVSFSFATWNLCTHRNVSQAKLRLLSKCESVPPPRQWRNTRDGRSHGSSTSLPLHKDYHLNVHPTLDQETTRGKRRLEPYS